MSLSPFHLAVPVHNIAEARKFYGETLGCPEGRSTNEWIDFDLFGHQFVVHLNENMKAENHVNAVDGHGVPIPHFGVVLEWGQWETLAEKMKSIGTDFVIDPYIRFKGCLLYTSPSPRDRQKSRMPSSA